MSGRDDINKLLATHYRRLQILKEQRASFGSLHVPAHIVTGIEDTEADIKALETELETLEDNDSPGTFVGAVKTDHTAHIPLQRPRRAEHFTGREPELAQLLTDLQPGKTVTLTGPGGIGKSALAAEAIWTLAPDTAPPERFPDGIVFYSFYSQPATALALEHLVRSFDATARDTSPQAAYRLLSRKQALIILDGAEAADDLRVVLDVMANCGVLVTSRKRSDAVAAPQAINPLPEDQAVALLRKWGGTQVNDEDAAQDICCLVGGLPLAVRLVGRYLTANGETATEYLTWLQETPLQALDQGERRDESVLYLIERSLAEVSDEANQVLAVTGLLALAPFNRTAVQAALPEVNTRHALGELVSYGLLLRPTELYETGHALIHTYARRRLVTLDKVLIRLAEYYTKLAEEQSALGPPGYAVLNGERIHLVTVLEQCVEHEAWEAARSLAWGVDGYLDIQGHWTERVAVLKMGLKVAQILKKKRFEGAFLDKLGSAYFALGQVEQAINYHHQALEIAYVLGNRQGKGASLNNLGLAYRILGRTDEAIDHHKQALIIHREVGNKRSEGNALGNLGLCYHALGQVKKAIDHYTQALIIHREIGNKRSESNQLSNLGSAYLDLGQVEQAIDYHQQALTIAREIGDKKSEGNQLGNLGIAYHSVGNTREAIDYYFRALIIDREIGDKRGESSALGNLGSAYRDLGQVEQAIDFHTQGLAIAREIGNKSSEGNQLGNLGLAFRDLEQIEQAIDYFQQALTIAREIGNKSSEGNQLGNLGLAYRDLGQIEQVIDYFQQALVIQREIGDKRGEGNQLSNLGLVYRNLGQVERAREHLAQSLAIFEETKSPNAELVRKWLDALGS